MKVFMKTNLKILHFPLIQIVVFFSILFSVSCNKKILQNQSANSNANIDFWLTNPNQSSLLQHQNTQLIFGDSQNSYQTINVDSSITYQKIDGFGFTLTGGSASSINELSPNIKSALLHELFDNNDQSIGISYLRLSVGASDLNETVFSYDDMPQGQTDTALQYFNFSQDSILLIPLLKEILLINPHVKLLASPWSAPTWMKDNNNSMGGHLQPQYYRAYANYFVKYIQGLSNRGIKIDAITIQNEPEHGGNNPSMLMTAFEQVDFIKNFLGPAFQSSGINTKIIIWDHNCDNPNYPITVLNDQAARNYIDGSAFHLYAGDISALSLVHDAFPQKNLYFTEQWTGGNDNFSSDLTWHVKNVIVGSMRNWSRIALEWNLANKPDFTPHTPGGCTLCKGALTIDSSITRNVSYYIIAHAAKFVPSESVRISSNITGNLFNVAFLTPNGNKVLIVVNDSNANTSFNIKFNNKWTTTTLSAGAVATYKW